MRFERISNIEHPMYEKALELYSISFPAHEQRESVSQTQILSDGEYYFSLIYDEDIFVGLLLYWETLDYIYVEHFCILPEMRNNHYGQKSLELLGQRKKTVILEIDPPSDAVSVRRKGFYERNGFVENPYSHAHPPYHKGNVGHTLVVMSSPTSITRTEYDDFKHYLDYYVMKDVFS